MKNIVKENKIFIIGIVLLVYIFLPLSIYFGLINYNYKFYILTAGGALVYIIARMVGYSNQDLGITRINNKRSIVDVLPITLLLALLGLGLWLTGFSRIQMNESWLFFLFYIFISSPLQEFLYRGALGAFIQKLTKNYITRMLITSLLYSFVHIIYKDILTLALTFAIGLIWFRIYDKTKNLLGVSISHAVLGVVTIIAGIIN